MSNIFQHYGILTPTIDLVDNIFVAIWFALNKFKEVNESTCKYNLSNEAYGWLYFLISPTDLNKDSNFYDEIIDLRSNHSSLSARLHCQHGITYSRIIKDIWDFNNRIFDNKIIATVKIPNNEHFQNLVKGIKQEFLFPCPEFDNTYKYLKKEKFSKLLEKVTEEFSLNIGELGKIWNYSDIDDQLIPN